MSVTVSDCLKLPALREARLVAGNSGANRVVTAVSVIEYPKISLMSSDLVVLGSGEMSQCKAERKRQK